MKRLCSLVLALTLLASCLTGLAGAAENQVIFQDVTRDHPYYSVIRDAYEQGLMDGLNDSAFGPDAPLTRGVLVQVLARLAGIDLKNYSGDTGFKDVHPNNPLAPYVIWASQSGITNGASSSTFQPDGIVDREQFAAMAGHLLQLQGLEKTTLDSPPAYADAEDISDWARDSIYLLQIHGVRMGDSYGYLYPKEEMTRAEAAGLFCRLREVLYGNDSPVVNTWIDFVPLSEAAIPDTDDPIISADEIVAAAEAYGFSAQSTAFQALTDINAVYAPILDWEDRQGALIFLFEGAGADSSPEVRMNALCVVVTDGEITYLSEYSSTIPDDPFNPRKNEGYAMPTLNSGIYRYTTLNQNGVYAALNVSDAQVVRFWNQGSYFQSTSSGINIHRRGRNTLSPAAATWANSFGCCLIGLAGTGTEDDYAGFISAVGLVPQGSSGNDSYAYRVSGTVVVDRSYAADYLRSIGYPEESIEMLG